MNLDEKRKLRLLRKIKTYREILFKETVLQIETEEEVEKMERKRVRLEREITNTVNRMFPTIYPIIIQDVVKHGVDFYLYDVPKMLMNERFDGILMTRKSGVQFYCLGTDDEKSHFEYYMKTANFVRLYEVNDGEIVGNIRASRALEIYEGIEASHRKSEAN